MTAEKLQLSNRTHIAVVSADGHRVVEVRRLREAFCVDALIRLPIDDFAEFTTLKSRYTHFNLEQTLNEAGKRYAILPIVESGYRDADNREVLPVCDAEQHRTGLCLEVCQGIQIESVSLKYFQYSIPSVRNPDQLGLMLLKRYARLFPGLSEEEILSRGCATTVLQLD